MLRLTVIAMRLDVYLTENGYAESRTEAKGFITCGGVTVNGKVVSKPAFFVLDTDTVTVDRSSKKYASRGGLKLEAALDIFGISPMGKRAIDIGASSGGFTDCLLIRGAEHVIAVDSGSGQLVERLRASEQVTVIENYNARYMSASDFEYTPELAVMDVSFISATYILRGIYECLAEDSDLICLIKPQFEVGRALLGKGGIVKDEPSRRLAVDKVTSYAEGLGFRAVGVITSPIVGGDGNIEYLAHFRKGKA